MADIPVREKMSRDDQLDSLIRLLAPARALKEDLEKRLHLELYAGTGDFALQNFQALQASVARVTEDTYLSTMILETPPNAGDKEKVSLAALAASQLLAYIMGQTGIAAAGLDFGGGGGKGKSHNISTGVHIDIHFTDNQGVSPETFDKMADLAHQSLKLAETQNEEEA